MALDLFPVLTCYAIPVITRYHIYERTRTMKKDLTELVFILDMSGSMSSLTGDTIGGFNSVLKEHNDGNGEVLVTTYVFNNESKMLHDRLPIADVPAMTEKDYSARGCTALLDAIGGAIQHIAGIHRYAREEDVPEHTIFVITTDGMENASHRYSSDEVKAMVRKQKEQHGWEFLFLGANMDAISAARSFGIREDRAVRYACDSVGTSLNFAVTAQAISRLRKGKGIDADWSAPIAEDYEKRGK